METASVIELLRRGTDEARRELRLRGVLRSAAAVSTGDYAEWLAASQLGVQRMPQSQQGFDLAPLPDGTRVQVKGRRVSDVGRVPPIYGHLHALDDREFDALALVLLEADWSVRESWWVPWEAVKRIGRWNERRHDWRVSVRGRWHSDAAVAPLDLSAATPAAERRWGAVEPPRAPVAPAPVIRRPVAALGRPGPRHAVSAPRAAPPPATRVSPANASVLELVRAFEAGDGSAGPELRRRSVLEGSPASPAGEYARHLVAEHLGGHRVAGEGYGVVSDGERLQVPGRHRKAHRDPSFWSVRYDPENQEFDAVVVVLFEVDFSVAEAWRVPWDAVGRLAVRYRGTGYRLPVGGPWRHDPAVRRVPL